MINKDLIYFPHFAMARNDRKIKRLRKELGAEGYGLYFMTLEVLREQPEMKYPIADIDLLADDFGTSEPKLRAVISNYNLFVLDNENFFLSVKLTEYLEPYFKARQQRINAINSRWLKEKNKENNDTTVLRPNNDRNSPEIQSKVKYSKVEYNNKELNYIVDEKNSSTEKTDFIQNLIEIFKEMYLNAKGEIYLSHTGKDRSAVGKILTFFKSYYKEKNLIKNTEETLNDIKELFRIVLNIKSGFYYSNCTLSIISSKINEIILINKNGGFNESNFKSNTKLNGFAEYRDYQLS